MHIALGNLPCDTEICITSLLQLSKMMLLSLFPCFDYLFKCSVPPLPKGCNYPYRLNLLTLGGGVVQMHCQCGSSVNQTFCPFITSFIRSPHLRVWRAGLGRKMTEARAQESFSCPGLPGPSPLLCCQRFLICFLYSGSSNAEAVSSRCKWQPLDNYLTLLQSFIKQKLIWRSEWTVARAFLGFETQGRSLAGNRSSCSCLRSWEFLKASSTIQSPSWHNLNKKMCENAFTRISSLSGIVSPEGPMTSVLLLRVVIAELITRV